MISSLCALRLSTGEHYDANLQALQQAVAQTPAGALCVAPEVCLTGFDYARFEAAAAFADTAHAGLCAFSAERTLILTLIEKQGDAFYNVARVYHRGRLVHAQTKAHLFALGDETAHFTPGDASRIVPLTLDGTLRLGILICFELRFSALWQQLRGADVIAVPAQWGGIRAAHYKTLGEALAVMNQCYVVQSDGVNTETSGQCSVTTPFGVRSETPVPYDPKEVAKMRRYLNVGLA